MYYNIVTNLYLLIYKQSSQIEINERQMLENQNAVGKWLQDTIGGATEIAKEKTLEAIKNGVIEFFTWLFTLIWNFILQWLPECLIIIAYCYMYWLCLKIFLFAFISKEDKEEELYLKLISTPIMFGICKLFIEVIFR